MKHVAGCLLLLNLSALCGCGSPTPGGAAGAPTAVRVPDLNERHAANFLEMSQNALEQGNRPAAIKGLRRLIADYPNTPAADAAAELLADLETLTVPGREQQDGGGQPSADRDKAQQFLTRLADVESAAQERQLLSEFGDWLRQNGYHIEVEQIDRGCRLTCGCFPPVTPWVTHEFLDEENLQLLPQQHTEAPPETADQP